MISMDEVEKLLAAPGVVVVDANGRDLFEKGHLPGARHLETAGMGAVLPEGKETKLVFYCSSPR
jgi:rhodanese-related sulfurtransferase